MIIVAGAFAIIFAALLVPYWLFVVRPEQQDRDAVLKRLKMKRATPAMRAGLLKTAERLSAIPTVDAFLMRSRQRLGPVEGLLEQAAVRMTVATFLLMCAVAGLVTFALAYFVTSHAIIALPLAACATWIPVAVVRFMRTRRLAALEEQFPEALDLLSRALKAGHAFTTGILMVADEVPAPVGPEFRTLYEQQNFGMPMPDALRGFATRIPVLDAKFFATAVMTQRESGGNLSEVLDNLASVIRDRFKVKRQIRVISAHGRITGAVLTAVPPCLAVVLFIISPEHWRILFSDPLGVRLIVAAIVLQVTGGLIIKKLVQIPY